VLKGHLFSTYHTAVVGRSNWSASSVLSTPQTPVPLTKAKHLRTKRKWCCEKMGLGPSRWWWRGCCSPHELRTWVVTGRRGMSWAASLLVKWSQSEAVMSWGSCTRELMFLWCRRMGMAWGDFHPVSKAGPGETGWCWGRNYNAPVLLINSHQKWVVILFLSQS
jgi:hypothetical protein